MGRIIDRKAALWIAGAAAAAVAAGLAVWLWPRGGGEGTRPRGGGEGAAAARRAEWPVVRVTSRPAVKERLSASTFVGTDGRMYSSYDIDGDGLYDADEIRQYGTLMYGPGTRAGARSIERVEVPNPDDTDCDGLPDEWEMGYFGTQTPRPPGPRCPAAGNQISYQ